MTKCRWCGKQHGTRCPEVKALEFHANGRVKKVIFVTGVDVMPVGGWQLQPLIQPVVQPATDPYLGPQVPYYPRLGEITCTTAVAGPTNVMHYFPQNGSPTQ